MAQIEKSHCSPKTNITVYNVCRATPHHTTPHHGHSNLFVNAKHQFQTKETIVNSNIHFCIIHGFGFFFWAFSLSIFFPFFLRLTFFFPGPKVQCIIVGALFTGISNEFFHSTESFERKLN